MQRQSTLVLGALAIVLGSCGSPSPDPAKGKGPVVEKKGAAPGGPELPVNHPPAGGGATQPSDLPSGHPPLGESPHGDVVPPAEGSGTGSAALTWTVPEGWTVETPSSSMRKAQYRVPGEGGEAECIVFYFGPGQGGDAKSNADRWAGQFAGADGGAVTPVTKEIEVSGLKVMTVEAAGTYGGGAMMGGPPTEPKSDWLLLGAIVEGPDANWFFKLTGPKATVEAQRAAFDGMLQTLRTGPA